MHCYQIPTVIRHCNCNSKSTDFTSNIQSSLTENLLIEGTVINGIRFFHCWLFALCCTDSAKSPAHQPTNELTKWVAGRAGHCCLAYSHVSTLAWPFFCQSQERMAFQMPNTNRHLPSAPLSCVQALLCTTGQMLNKDHDTTTGATQFICIVLANYVNICKRPFTAERCHIIQCYWQFGRGLGVFLVLFHVLQQCCLDHLLHITQTWKIICKEDKRQSICNIFKA